MDKILNEYFNLKQEEKVIKQKIQDLRDQLLPRLQKSNIETENFLAKITNSTRESFSLKEARKELEEDVLRPFIKATAVSSVKVTAKKVVELKKAS